MGPTRLQFWEAARCGCTSATPRHFFITKTAQSFYFVRFHVQNRILFIIDFDFYGKVENRTDSETYDGQIVAKSDCQISRFAKSKNQFAVLQPIRGKMKGSFVVSD